MVKEQEKVLLYTHKKMLKHCENIIVLFCGVTWMIDVTATSEAMERK